MTKEEKQLLLKDLCARLPYGVKFNYCGYSGCDYVLEEVYLTHFDSFPIEDCKPYLRPMSSMTEEEKKEYCDLQAKFLYSSRYPVTDAYGLFDWLNAHQFDFRGLIPMGLALEAPEDMYKEG